MSAGDKLIGRRLGNYELRRRIGAGAMGFVYLAQHVGLNKPAAVKIMAPELLGNGTAVPRFLREAQMAASLEHPNVVQVYDVGESEGLYYLAMQFVEGQSLDRALNAKGKFDIREAAAIVRKVALALGAAHKLGIVHRDIKPANVLLSNDGQVKVADFGLARAGDASLSVSGQIIGTPYYMAPEQGEGRAVDARADLYALGATFYHLVTGRRLFESDTPISIILKHVNETPVPPERHEPSIPAAYSRVILKLLQKKPEDRFASAEELVKALDAADGAEPAPVPAAADSWMAPRVEKSPRPSPATSVPAGNRSLAGASMARDYRTKDDSPEERLKAEGKSVVGKYLLLRELQKIDDDLSVWEGENVQTKAKVALRVLTGHDSERIRAFYRLAAEATTLRHPNIVHVIECHSDTDARGRVAHYMAMELSPAPPLKTVVASRSLTTRQLAGFALQLADALEFAHQRRRLNLAFSPADVRIEAPSRALLSFHEFGMSKGEEAKARFAALETAPYLAPEQVPNVEAAPDTTTDVYRLGALLYFMTTGKPPFEASSLAEYYDKILSTQPRPPRELEPKLDAELERIITTAMRKEKRLRYAKAADLAAALRKYLKEDAGESAAPATRRAVKTSLGERVRLAAALHGRRLALLGVLAALAGGGVWGWRTWRPRWDADSRDTRLRRLRVEAQAAYSEGRYPAALDAAGKALELDPEDAQMRALVKGAKRKTLEGAVLRGIPLYEAAGDADLGRTLGELERAVAELAGSLASPPISEELSSLAAAGRGLYALGHFDRAASLLAKAAAMGIPDAESALTLARAHFGRIVLSTAAARLLKAEDRSPEWKILLAEAARGVPASAEGARADLAGAYAALGGNEAGRAKSLAASALGKGGGAEAKLLRGWASGAEGLADLEASIQERPRQTLAYVARALRRAEAGVAADAVKDLDEALRSRPNHAALHLLRAGARRLAGDVEGARLDAARARALAPKDWEQLGDVERLEQALPR